MMDVVYTAVLFLVLLVSAGAGSLVRSRLTDTHLTRDSIDSVRLLMGMLLTFSALVLGLLTSNAKQRFDGYNADLSTFGADLIEVDHRLRVYGPEGDGIRVMLRSYTATAIADSWPDEVAPPGSYPRFGAGAPGQEIESVALGRLLSSIESRIERLRPEDDFHRQVASSLRERFAQVIRQRWRLIFSARSTISWPFLLVLTSWLSIIFAIFGLTSPRTPLIYAVVVLSALSIASPLYLILDYSDALTGLIQLSSEPLRTALSHMDEATQLLD